MKHLRKIGISILVVYAILLGFEKSYDFFLHFDFGLKNSYITERKIDADILIHGTCIPYTMIIPDSIEKLTNLKTYNLADYHSDYAENYLSLYLYLKHSKAPKLLFLYASPECLDAGFNTFNPARFTYFMEDTVVRNVVKDCEPKYYSQTAIPFFKYTFFNKETHFKAYTGFKCWLKNDPVTPFPNGYYPAYDVKGNPFIRFKAAYPKGYHFRWSSRREAYLKKILALAKKHQIRVVLYESPELKEEARFQKGRQKIMGQLTNFASANKVDFLAFDDLPQFRKRSNFITTVALTNESAQAFSRFFAQVIKDKYLK